VGECTPEDEASRLDRDDDLDPRLDVGSRELIEHVLERAGVLEEGGDVLEEDAFGREVPDVADLGLQLGYVHAAPLSCGLPTGITS
jgi:hypothetical protein